MFLAEDAAAARLNELAIKWLRQGIFRFRKIRSSKMRRRIKRLRVLLSADPPPHGHQLGQKRLSALSYLAVAL